MSKKFRLLMVLVLATGLLGGLLTASTVSADPWPGTFIQIPRIDVAGSEFGDGWQTRIQIQNVSGIATTVTVEFYGGDPYLCPPNEDGPFYWTEMEMPVNGIWTLQSAIPAGARSAFISTDPAATLAVTVDRWGPDPDPEGSGFMVSSSYTGVPDPMPGAQDPIQGAYEYYAPYLMDNYLGRLNTVITIQNSGDACTSVWIYYKQEGNCECMKAHHIEQIAPGEMITVGPVAIPTMVDWPADASVGCAPGNGPDIVGGWLGSAYITANEPLGIIVDQLGDSALLTMRAMPFHYDWNYTWYADLLYRELSGWDSSIQVQNLTKTSQPTFVTVDFFDQSGDEIFFVGDWVCRNGAKTFYLPAITDLGINFPFGYVGAAEIQSHDQVDYPGGVHEGQPIFAIVDLKKRKMWDGEIIRHTLPGEIQAGAYNAHPYWQKWNAFGWAMPHIAKEQDGMTSRIAIRNNGNCNKITGDIYIFDETGNLVTMIPVPWLHPKHMKVVDLAYFGQLPRGFVGAAIFIVDGVEQLCDVDFDGHVDPEPVMPSVVVLNYGWERELPPGPSAAGEMPTDGDYTRVYEAFPYLLGMPVCYGSIFGTATVRQAWHGFDFDYLEGVDVYVDDSGLLDETDSTGGYQVKDVEEFEHTVTFTKTGFFDLELETEVFCGEETKLDPELICSNPLFVTVEDTQLNPIPGATVTVTGTFEVNDDAVETYTTEDVTDNAGEATFDVAGAADLEVVASAPGHDDGTVNLTRDPDNVDCYDSPEAGVQLCKWNTVVGTVFIGGEPAEGYTLKAIQMSNPDLPEVDSDVTTANGVFSLENLSLGTGGPDYRVQLWSPSETYIDFLDFSVPDCGQTGVLSYTNGVWDGPENWTP
jgi:hypothetical protein